MLDENHVNGKWHLLPMIGIDVVEIVVHAGADEKTVDETARAVEEAGLSVWSVHAPFGETVNISSPDDDIRAAGIEGTATAVRACATFSGQVVVVHCGDKLIDGQNADEVRRLSMESVSRILEEVGDLSPRLALENLPSGYVTQTVDELMAVVSEFPEEKVGVCIDTGHGHTVGDAADIIDGLAERIITTHLHDNDSTGDQHLLPGSGTIDWEAVGKALGRTGYDGPLMFEVSGPGSPEEALPKLMTAARMIDEYMGMA